MLTLAPRGPLPGLVEFPGLTPDRLAGHSLAEIERWPGHLGNRPVALADLFTVIGDAADQSMRVVGDIARWPRIGAGMAGGTLTVEGVAGGHAGAGMAGGTLTIVGRAGDWLGAELRGGVIRVVGNAGDQVGAAYRGSRHGMRGGAIHVSGDAGAELGLLMRRGLITVGGSVGAFAAASLIAGTVALAGRVGPHLGAGAKRGTVLVRGLPADLSPGFRHAADVQPAYLGLLTAWLREQGAPWPAPAGPVPLWRGDFVAGGRGELFVMPVG